MNKLPHRCGRRTDCKEPGTNPPRQCILELPSGEPFHERRSLLDKFEPSSHKALSELRLLRYEVLAQDQTSSSWPPITASGHVSCPRLPHKEARSHSQE